MGFLHQSGSSSSSELMPELEPNICFLTASCNENTDPEPGKLVLHWAPKPFWAYMEEPVISVVRRIHLPTKTQLTIVTNYKCVEPVKNK